LDYLHWKALTLAPTAADDVISVLTSLLQLVISTTNIKIIISFISTKYLHKSSTYLKIIVPFLSFMISANLIVNCFNSSMIL